MTSSSAIGDVAREVRELLREMGVESSVFTDGELTAHSPITGEAIGRLSVSAAAGVTGAIGAADEAFRSWRNVPAPRRGELVRLFGEELRAAKPLLAQLVTLEAGKIASEGLGEVQEMIDICDFAVGLSRQLHGSTIATERPGHRMMETWHPLGAVGVITSFNFPVAVWAWNAALALVCGDTVLWKPSEKTPLTALATQALLMRAAERFGEAPPGLSSVLLGGSDVGAKLVEDARVRLVSATGSTAMGRAVAPQTRAKICPGDPGAWRQQRGDHMSIRPFGPGDARRRLRRDGDRGTALHDAAAPHRPRGRPWRAGQSLAFSLRLRACRRSARESKRSSGR